MKIFLKIHSSEEAKEVISRLVYENLEKKLNSYLKKFDNENSELIIDLKIDKNKKDLFDGKMIIDIKPKLYNFIVGREDYKKLDDLVNHLFDHLKEDLAKK